MLANALSLLSIKTHRCCIGRIVSYSTRILLFQQMLANRLLSLENVSRSSIGTQCLAHFDSNAELIKAMFERWIMVDRFLIAYITTLSLSAQLLQHKSVVVSSLMGEEHRLKPTYQHLYSPFLYPLDLGCPNLQPCLLHPFIVLCSTPIRHCGNQTSY